MMGSINRRRKANKKGIIFFDFTHHHVALI
jgi:hypothetical protein